MILFIVSEVMFFFAFFWAFFAASIAPTIEIGNI
jgi:cytochrome c oxidase subunit 3